jgi:beta-lactamase superfamily II metal-dependent hydrolase
MAKQRPEPAKPLIPPPDGATVRMYRTGHGDCFLLAFPGRSPDRPAYVLIDCGYKPGSPKFINTTIQQITRNIRQATGGRIDVAVITHEHQDHVNGITAANFAGITIGETWLAWTEDPTDKVADKLRTAFKDKLLGLLAARKRLAAALAARKRLAAADPKQVRRADEYLARQVGWIDEYLAFELGGKKEKFDAPASSMNKKSMKVFRDLAEDGVKYLRPHDEILALPGAKDVRVFALGPPRDQDQLEDLEPQSDEQFHLSLATASAGNYFAAAVAEPAGHGQSPFSSRYALGQAKAFKDPDYGTFFTHHYGRGKLPHSRGPDSGPRSAKDKVPDNPDWRRIDKEWLYSAERLALDLNNYTNNASLVLAFELGKGGKVLLFAADAQRGNWVSWGKKDWIDGDKKVTARDLLARTVLYKVGHHGSHNATLNGLASGDAPNLAWMAQGEYAREFTAMITAVRDWAETQGWDHPLKAIKDALLKKAAGRVFQTDTDLDKMAMPPGATQADWKRFLSRATGDRLYFDYTIRS